MMGNPGSSAQNRHGPLILLADDEEGMRKVLAQRLTHWGYGVVSAKDGLEALRLAKAHRPKLILLDIMMPGLDGLEVCHELKAMEETRKIPIVFVTAKESKAIRLQAVAEGAAGFIQKPYDLDELLATIRRALGGS